MASAAEQLAANINWSAFGKAEELKKRIWFTLGALVIFRLGTYIPLPGIDPAAFEASFLGQTLEHAGHGRRFDPEFIDDLVRLHELVGAAADVNGLQIVLNGLRRLVGHARVAHQPPKFLPHRRPLNDARRAARDQGPRGR